MNTTTTMDNTTTVFISNAASLVPPQDRTALVLSITSLAIAGLVGLAGVCFSWYTARTEKRKSQRTLANYYLQEFRTNERLSLMAYLLDNRYANECRIPVPVFATAFNEKMFTTEFAEFYMVPKNDKLTELTLRRYIYTECFYWTTAMLARLQNDIDIHSVKLRDVDALCGWCATMTDAEFIRLVQQEDATAYRWLQVVAAQLQQQVPPFTPARTKERWSSGAAASRHAKGAPAVTQPQTVVSHTSTPPSTGSPLAVLTQ